MGFSPDKTKFFLIIFIAWCFTSCDADISSLFHSQPDLDDVHVVSDAYRTHPDSIRFYLDQLAASDRDTLAVDRYCLNYYQQGKPFVWITFTGLKETVDTLCAVMSQAAVHGLSPKAFYADRIARQLDSLLPSRIDSLHTNANKALAHIEYYLTKGYLRYASGLRHGVLAPQALLNHLDRNDQDGGKTFKRLMNLPIEQPGKDFFADALQQVDGDVVSYLEQLAPQDNFYRVLSEKIQADTISAKTRNKLAVNMERCRWRIKDDPRMQPKYVLVNIPAFYLYAIDENRVLAMKMGCGAYATKTPLMVSQIKRIDINPKWVIPRSILKNEVANHLGDSGWFARRRYIVRDHTTGRIVDPRSVSREKLLGGNFSVAQESGAGNALGRIIFRFDNPFSVYIHHTSSPGFFANSHRAVSHGCVRVEQPYDLAEFVLGKGYEQTMEKIRYSTSADISSMSETARQRGIKPSSSLDRSKLINAVDVSPRVPLYIAYYTYYPASHRLDGSVSLEEYPDVYGYDRALLARMQRDGYATTD